jgi:putative phage-type endonuclease
MTTYTVIIDSHADEDAWLDARMSMITASDVATVMGLNPFKSALELYLEKLGLKAPFEGNEATEWGQRSEPMIVDGYRDRTGREVSLHGKLLRSKEYPFIGCTLDAEAIIENVTTDSGEHLHFSSKPRIPLELKTTGAHRADDWDEGCPPYYMPQVQTQMLVTGANMASVACLIGGQRMVWADVERDDSIISDIIQACTEFWEAVQNEEPPAPDGSYGSGEALKLMYPEEEEGKVVTLDQDAIQWDEKLRETEASIKELEGVKWQLRQNIQAAMGDAEKAVLPGGLGAWKWTTQERKQYKTKASKTRVLRRVKK